MYQVDRRVCSACGTALAAHEAFCNHCGKPYNAAYAPPPSPVGSPQLYDNRQNLQAPQRRSPWLIGSISALVLLALIGGGFFFLVLPRLGTHAGNVTQAPIPTIEPLHINPYSYTGHSSVVWQVAWSHDG